MISQDRLTTEASVHTGFPSSWQASPSLAAPAGPRPDLRAIVESIVAGVFDVDVELLRKPTRGRARVALARQVAMYICHVGCGHSLTEVGELFGRDRTTVAHACNVVEMRRDEEWFDQAIDLLELSIKILAGPGPGGTWRC